VLVYEDVLVYEELSILDVVDTWGRALARGWLSKVPRMSSRAQKALLLG
jgi:hypothetical protein